MPADTLENNYSAELEASRLQESLAEEENAGFLEELGGKAKKARKSFSTAAKGVASGQYAIWQAIWDFLAPTFGLSLLLIYVPIFSWLAKKTFPESIARMLPEPGEDGMLGFVPPPPPGAGGAIRPLYGLVNKIAMGVLFMILTPIILLLFVITIAPIVFAVDAFARVLGPLGEIFNNLFGGF